MSIIIRQQLEVALASLSVDILRARGDCELPNDSSALERIGHSSETLARGIRQSQNLLREWTTVLSSPEEDIRTNETRIFEAFRVENQTPGQILNEGLRTQTQLDLKIDLIRSQQPSSGLPEPPQARPQFTLPALHLPDFDGQDSNWPSFWAAFRHTIHENGALNGAQKLTYLVGRLKGTARALVEGFALTDSNYSIVIDLLKGRYGDDSKRADRLRSELFHLSKPSSHSSSLRSFSEHVESICRQLEALGTSMEDNPFLTVAIKEKLPIDVRTQLYDKEMEAGRPWTSKEWRDGLIRVVRLKEAVHTHWEPPNSSSPNPPKAPTKSNEPIKRAFPLVETEKEKETQSLACFLCHQEGHKASKCPGFKTAEQKIARLIEQGRCSRCTRKGHAEKNCPSQATCYRCGELHHALVCLKQWIAKGSNAVPLGQRNVTNGNNGQGQPKKGSNMATPIIQSNIPSLLDPQIVSIVQGSPIPPPEPDRVERPTAYLMIKNVPIFNCRNPAHPVLAPVFFDPGAQPSFITKKLVSQTNPDWVETEMISVGGFQGNTVPNTHSFPSPRYSVRLQREDGGWEEVKLNQTDRIVPPVEFLRDVRYNPPNARELITAYQEPQILLGVGEFWKFFRQQREILPGLFRINTVFGPVFGGEIKKNIPQMLSCPLQVTGAIVPGKPPEDMIQKLWNLESIGITDSPEANEEETATIKFINNVAFKDGRYEVGWPWRTENKERLSNNFSLAYSRLSALSAKFRNNADLREKYTKAISDLRERGIIESAHRTGVNEFFLPHHAVINPKKLRVVHDASAHEKGKFSLNDLLLIGPNLVPELAGILLRFRETPYPVLGDIEKAFLAVGLREEDREYAKFLWMKDPSSPLCPDNLVIVRFTRIAFGVNSSPFLLASVLRHHLLSLGNPLNMARNFYVDNLLLCNQTVAEATSSVHTAREVMSRAGMRLREFTSTVPEILAGVPPEDVLVGEVQKVLGISWNQPQDALIFPFPDIRTYPNTRRGVLSAIASLFDPLGLCSPCLVKQKIFFQSLWDTGKGWDDSLIDPHLAHWQRTGKEWEGSILSFPRPTPASEARLQLHIFSDAGPDAYATAAYLRAEWDHKVTTSLLFAKSRLRPKKMTVEGITIPRMELLGLLIAVRAKKFITANFDRPFESVYFWADSQIVLSWLAGNGPQPIFVANRLAEIRGERDAIFRYVRSADNPADWGARGASPKELNESILWRDGPEWLRQPEGEWPKEYRDIILPPEESLDHNGEIPPGIVAPVIDKPPYIVDPVRYGSWAKLLRITAKVLCFLSRKFGKSEKARGTFPFTSELENADPLSALAKGIARKWIIQREQYGMDILGAVKDKDGIYRLRTRLIHSEQSTDFKFPIVLPRESWVTRLLVLSAHGSLAHAGIDLTLSHFLREYWCPRARRLVKYIIKDCPICKRDRAIKFALPPMPPLPGPRVLPSPPFTHVGLDYMGPTSFRSEEGPKKAWVLLLTCLSTRALHLELVDNLSTNGFLSAFRRFVSRRGMPKRIWSDNGTQLVLGRQVLMAYYEFPMEWSLIPPHSPWAGGVYERIVGLVKTSLRRCLGRSTPSWEQLHTLLCEVEATLNCRPITFVSDAKEGTLPLRPIDFLLPSAQIMLEEPDEPEEPYNPSSAEKLAHLWHLTNEALRRFWDFWNREYLLILRGRIQDTHKGPRSFAPQLPKVGDIVLVEQEDSPRNLWPLGKIVSLNPLSPAKARSAIVLIGGKQLERSVNQLVPLEATAEWKEVEPADVPQPRQSARGQRERQDAPTPHFKWAPITPSIRRGKMPLLPVSSGHPITLSTRRQRQLTKEIILEGLIGHPAIL